MSDPDSEVHVLLFEYVDGRLFASMDGKTKFNKDEHKLDQDRFVSIVDNPPDKYEQICMIEAGLIRYFQPVYNKTFVDNFPNSKLKTLKKCYNLDISGLVVEINTDVKSVYLYSESVPPKQHHLCQYELTDPKVRAGVFHIHGRNGEHNRISGVISSEDFT
jgi:hypothetical protein